MVALKAAAIEAFVARPDPARPVVLLFGPDAGLIAERSRRLLQLSVDDLQDPFMLVRLEGDELAADPARLIDEASTLPIFGGRRAIVVKAGSRDFTPAVAALSGQRLADCRIIIEAQDLKRSSPLRALFERARDLVALPCYGDSERDLSRLIDEELRGANLRISEEARAALLPLLGADRKSSLSELRKLSLFAAGQGTIELADVLAVVSDAANLAVEGLIDAAFAGQPATVDLEYARAKAAGIAPGRVLSTLLAQAGQLHRARLEVEAGAPLSEAAAEILTKAQFRRRPAVEAALKRWSAARLEAVLGELAETALATRKLSGPAAALADTMVARALLLLALGARRSSPQAG